MRTVLFLLAVASLATSVAGCSDDSVPMMPGDASIDGGADAASDELDFAEFDTLLTDFVEEAELEGMSAAIVDRDLGLVHARGYGDFAEDRIYLIASTGKILTAGVIMRLADQGVVDIDAPIGDYVGDVWGEGKSELTLAQMLSNSAGLPALSDFAYEPYLCQFDPGGTVEQCAETIYVADDADDRVEPDTEFNYGGAQWHLAGGVAIVASGKQWPELVEETYVEPCGTESLGFTNQFGSAASEYPEVFQGDPANVPSSGNLNIEGGGYTHVIDYAQLLLMHLRGGVCGDDRVLSEEAVARMQMDRIGEVYDGRTVAELLEGNEDLEGYGLGWWVDRATGVVVDPGAYGAVSWLDEELGYAAVFMMESEVAVGSELAKDAVPLLSDLFSD